MPPQYRVRRVRGNAKGQFVKKNVLLARENVLASMQKTFKIKAQGLSSLQNNDSVIKNLTSCSRRAVELDKLASNLWCDQCNIPLSLRNLLDEYKQGVASLLKIKCIKCDIVYYVPTNTYNKKSKCYEVNDKLAFGMIDAGFGEAHINTIFSSLDIPPISTTTLKCHERNVGRAIEEEVKESCIEAIRLEKKLTLENEPEQDL